MNGGPKRGNYLGTTAREIKGLKEERRQGWRAIDGWEVAVPKKITARISIQFSDIAGGAYAFLKREETHDKKKKKWSF